MTVKQTMPVTKKGDYHRAGGYGFPIKPDEITVTHSEGGNVVSIRAYRSRDKSPAPILLSLCTSDAFQLASLLLGLDVSKLYQYQEVIRDGEAEYGCIQYVEAESVEQAFELAMQYIVFNHGYDVDKEIHSYKEYLVDGRDDAVELPGDYRYFIVENLREFEMSDLVSSIQKNRIDRYPIQTPATS